ncbi:MAG: M15 family metallopeptidase, partial [Oscillospiraceae bacterium]|nr:M15 family metallopeptidase [Oscillospiraceae bacterium]
APSPLPANRSSFFHWENPAFPFFSEAEPTPDAPEEPTPWYLILANQNNPLPEDFSVPELTKLKNGHAIDSRAYDSLQAMLDGARAAGYDPMICSSYRSMEKQTDLFERKVQSYLNQGYDREDAEKRAARWVSPPGTSEHQAGLAVDIVDREYQVLNEAQEKRPVQQWLMTHCAEYGFILRYPTGKSDLTGVTYEPWHYRYVGEEAARVIMEGGLCLEEYLEN